MRVGSTDAEAENATGYWILESSWQNTTDDYHKKEITVALRPIEDGVIM